MKRRHAVLLTVVTGTLGLLGCDRAAPTEPDRALAEMSVEKTVPAGSLLLSGNWSGTITFHAFDGNSAGLACDGPAAVSVVLDQQGSSLTGRFRTSCAGELEIHGVVSGDGASGSLAGSLDSSSGLSLGRISGTLAYSRIAFQTKTTVGENSDGAPNKGGDRSVISSEVELHRQEFAARRPPVLARDGRPPRGVTVRR